LSEYNYRSEQIDDFVWEHQDMVVCFAAGNQGRKIQAEAASKNCITVGATEDRADDLTHISEKEYVGNNYGPTATNRAKPDIFAPGKLIQSARSRDCHRQHDGDVNWCRNTGTSMANALVAGCAGVLRQVIKISSTPPRAALVKAILICGADHLDQSISTSKLTSFRRVNLASSVQISVAETFGVGTLYEGCEYHIPIETKEEPAELIVTLCQGCQDRQDKAVKAWLWE
jgi:serine protease AprX